MEHVDGETIPRRLLRDDAYAAALVHGDFRLGNLIVGADGLHAVLDWELAHRGDPMLDLGWLSTKVWRFGGPDPVGGFGTRAELMAGYADGGGTPPDEATQRWWEVYGTVRWALLCRRQAARYLSGAESSIEFAVLGRRVCEQEFDVLLALGYATPVLTVANPGHLARPG
jgi:aminoglycoside phosphotransferase (APT) family kinase protein